MSLHQHNDHMRPDDEFFNGELSFLVKGNRCRLLDGRRTPGVIEEINNENGSFTWRITDFEDKGNYWEVPAEGIINYQFEKDSKRLSESELQQLELSLKKFQEILNIKIKEEEYLKTNELINLKKEEIKEWLKNNSSFFKSNQTLEFNSNIGSFELANDLKTYMEFQQLLELENETSKQMVLNPNSGEWIKGMRIVLAEMGLVSYRGKVPRTDIFEGMGTKEKRQQYIIHRLAFLRAFFDLLNIKEVTLYRGMAGETNYINIPKSFLSCTFNLEVANSFSENISMGNNYKIAYLMKLTFPIDQLFMTYLETAEMNKQYKEAEAIVLYNKKIYI